MGKSLPTKLLPDISRRTVEEVEEAQRRRREFDMGAVERLLRDEAIEIVRPDGTRVRVVETNPWARRGNGVEKKG